MTTPVTSPGAASHSEQRGKKLIAVASGKGGVGKTWFSITLAHSLSQQRQKPYFLMPILGLPTSTSNLV